MASHVVGFTQLVQYSDSSGEDGEETASIKVTNVNDKNIKRRNKGVDQKATHPKRSRMELPPALLTMFTDAREDLHEDRTQHQGRTRTFAHERGNWATHVYFPVAVDDLMVSLVNDLLGPSDTSWTPMPSPHLSVSRTVIVFHHWISELMAGLGAALRELTPFNCCLNTIELYTNDDKTRTFFGLRVTGHDDLVSVVETVDRCLAEYQLEKYYKNPSFHVSVAWTLGDITTSFTEGQKEALQDILTTQIKLNPKLGILDTSHAEAKCGNKIFSFPLKGS